MLAIAAALACASPVGVRRADPKDVHRELTANVLSAGRPSAPTLRVLERENLRGLFAAEPEAALAELHLRLEAPHDPERLFALAELSFLRGEESGDRRRHLACAVYAWALLFPGPGRALALERSDPRLRLAFDLYNRGLTAGLASDDGWTVDLSSRTVPLPFGTLAMRAPADGYAWGGHRLDELVAAADLEIRGLRNRYRLPGIGAPLAGSLGERIAGAQERPDHYRIPPRIKVPVTALLRIEDPLAALASGRVEGAVELWSRDVATHVEIDGRRVPLESETSSALAYTLEGTRLWDFELLAFFSGALRPVEILFGSDPQIRRARPGDGLFLRHPHRRGRIPVVLVHGTVSSPWRWAELVNELEGDPRIGHRYEIWLFVYNTGNPIGWSAGLLREALETTVAELDPEGTDAALRRMVVVGHSQGGLLAKLTAVSSGDRFWRRVSGRPFDSLALDERQRAVLRRTVFFEPLPFVRRIVFIATPHRGSYLASFSLARLLGSLITLPSELLRAGYDRLLADPLDDALRAQRRLPTSIDDMTPGNPFLEELAAMPVAPGVAAHSIVAIRPGDAVETGGDGVVRYRSAHVEGVVSERIVRSGHSAQTHPDTIEEVRRILLAHAEVGDR